jgi:hypothetical protein
VKLRALVLVAAAATLAACTPSDAILPSSPSAAPTPTGPLELAEVQDRLAGLPATEPFAWEGGVAVDTPANAQFTWLDYAATPLQCAPLFHFGQLQFEDDRDVAPSDVIVSKSLTDKAGPGPDDNRYLATVDVRLLDEPERGMRDAVYPLRAAADACGDGYVVTHIGLGTDSANVTHVEQLDTGIEDAVVLVTHSNDVWAPGQTVEGWIAVNNLLIRVGYYVDEEIAESSVEHATQVIEDVAAAFGATHDAS